MRPYLSAVTGILKAQSRQNIGTSICGIWGFFSFELFIQLYGQGHHARPFPSIIFYNISKTFFEFPDIIFEQSGYSSIKNNEALIYSICFFSDEFSL